MYYVLECLDPHDGFMASLDYRSDDPRRSWTRGSMFRNPPPIPVKANVIMRENSKLIELWVWPVPLMTKRLYDILIEAGVTNLEAFPAELTDPVSSSVYTDYMAFNVINNDELAHCAAMFRHEEYGLVVHKSVKTIIEAAGIDTLSFVTANI